MLFTDVTQVYFYTYSYVVILTATQSIMRR